MFPSGRIKTVNEEDHYKFDMCAPGRELVFGCLTGRINAKGSLQVNANGLRQWTLNISGYQAGSTEGRNHERVSNVRPKLELLTRFDRINGITSERENEPKRPAQEESK